MHGLSEHNRGCVDKEATLFYSNFGCGGGWNAFLLSISAIRDTHTQMLIAGMNSLNGRLISCHGVLLLDLLQDGERLFARKRAAARQIHLASTGKKGPKNGVDHPASSRSGFCLCSEQPEHFTN